MVMLHLERDGDNTVYRVGQMRRVILHLLRM
jgi:hypothetical protein